MANINTLVTLTPITGPTTGSYSPVVMSLIDHGSFSPSSSSGGWQVVDRPKSAAATQWFDRSPWQLKFDAYLDKSITTITPVTPPSTTQVTSYFDGAAPIAAVAGAQGAQSVVDTGVIGDSIEDYCSQLESWLNPVSGTYQPPIIKIDAKPLPGKSIKYWILYGLDFGESVRNTIDGERVQQKVSITLYEYLPPLSSGYDIYGITDNVSLFNSYIANSGSTTTVSSNYYQVKKTDTLQSIATAHKTTVGQLVLLNSGVSASQGKNFGKIYAGSSLLLPS